MWSVKNLSKWVAMMVLAVTVSACLPDSDIGSETERSEVRREAQATGLARSLSVVGSRVFSSFTSASNSPFVMAAQSGGVDALDTQMIDFQNTFGLSLGPAGDRVSAGYCGDATSGVGRSFVVWLSDRDAENRFLPKGLGDGASGAVMAELSNMSDPSSVGYNSNANRLEMQNGDVLSLGSCQNMFDIPIGAPVMVFANLQEVATIEESTVRTETRTQTCPAGQTGTITEKRDVSVAADGAESPGSWAVVTNLCSGTASGVSTAAVSASNADLLGTSGAALVGSLPDGVLRTLLGGLEDTACVSNLLTRVVIDPVTGETETITFDTCEEGGEDIADVDGLISVPVGDPYDETIARACSSSTLGENDNDFTVSTIPGTGNNNLNGVWSATIWSPNNGAIYRREVQDFNVTYPDGSVELISLRGQWEGLSLNCTRTETITFEANDFAPIWSSLGVDSSNLTLIEDSGISYSRTANVNGWADSVGLVPNDPSFSVWSQQQLSGRWQERIVTGITCPSGIAGIRVSTRTHTLTGYRTVSTSAWSESDNCGGTCLPDNSGLKTFNNIIQTQWVSLGTNSGTAQFTGPDGRLRDNCPTGWTATELRDDGDDVHYLTESSDSGIDHQLCIRSSNSSVTLLSEWRQGGCSPGFIHTGVFDSLDTGDSGFNNKNSKRYEHRHDLNEEDTTSNSLYWCLGVNDPSGQSSLSARLASSPTCNANETALVQTRGGDRNVNNEGGGSIGSFCVSLQSAQEDRVSCPITGPWTTGEWGTCSATCGGGTQTRTVTCENDVCTGSAPVNSRACNTQACAPTVTYAWDIGAWGTCSSSGTQTRTVTCRGSDGSTGSDSQCPSPKPATSQSCATNCPASWQPSEYTVSGSEGNVASAECESPIIHFERLCAAAGLDDNNCEIRRVIVTPNPSTGTSCRVNGEVRRTDCSAPPTCTPNTGAFVDVDFDWDGESTGRPGCNNFNIAEQLCLSIGLSAEQCEVRNVNIITGGSADGNEARCVVDGEARPRCVEDISTPPPAATFSWNTGAWSSCSEDCGPGSQTRTVECRNDSSGATVTDSNCSGTKPATSQACNLRACTTGAWNVGAWSTCNASCGGGTQFRSVNCPFDSCTGARPDSIQACNTQACGGPANAVCGSVSGTCDVGSTTGSTVSNGTTDFWTCRGIDGGSDASCSAPTSGGGGGFGGFGF